MILRRKLTVLDVAQYFGLAIEYSNDLPVGVHGCLEPGDDPRFILINPNQPIFEQQFTIAHEIAHYVLHHNRPRREYSNWFLNRKWQSRHLAVISRFARRAVAKIVTKEWEADLWAMLLLARLADADTLSAYLGSHPKKTAWLLLGLVASLYNALPRSFLTG